MLYRVHPSVRLPRVNWSFRRYIGPGAKGWENAPVLMGEKILVYKRQLSTLAFESECL